MTSSPTAALADYLDEQARRIKALEAEAEAVIHGEGDQAAYQALMRQKAELLKALAADASDLPELWLDVWGKYFAESQRQSGPGMQRLTIAGFAGVDAALEFLQAMASWDDAVQEPKLAIIEMNGATVNAQYVCRVINQQALEARLAGALGARNLRLSSQTGLTAP